MSVRTCACLCVSACIPFAVCAKMYFLQVCACIPVYEQSIRKWAGAVLVSHKSTPDHFNLMVLTSCGIFTGTQREECERQLNSTTAQSNQLLRDAFRRPDTLRTNLSLRHPEYFHKHSQRSERVWAHPLSFAWLREVCLSLTAQPQILDGWTFTFVIRGRGFVRSVEGCG